jgi:protein-S-isoprenylcysteine O-methyltransferase Ste14
MKTALDIFLIVLLFGLFGFLHTFLASNKIKKNIAEKAGNKMAFYPLFYNAVSMITLIAVIELSPKPDQTIYELRYPFDIIAFVLQALSMFGIVWALAYLDWGELSGAAQADRYFKGTYKIEEMDANQRMIVKGPYKISRHPLYFFFILFLAFRPYMDLFFLVIFICCTAYCFIGAHYEERKLIEKFGDEYIEYTKRTGKIFPVKFK